MAPRPLIVLLLVVCATAAFSSAADAAGTTDSSEEWGYVQVRSKAHMFWWLYHSLQRVGNGRTPWSTVLWLQGRLVSTGKIRHDI